VLAWKNELLIFSTSKDGMLAFRLSAVGTKESSTKICCEEVLSRRDWWATADILVERKSTENPSLLKARTVIKYSKFDAPKRPTTLSFSADDFRGGMICAYFLAARNAKVPSYRYVYSMYSPFSLG
jgi:hypothetical protein